ncbi:hypothetical protein P7K49_010431, partial [Saguinus oedipus]
MALKSPKPVLPPHEGSVFSSGERAALCPLTLATVCPHYSEPSEVPKQSSAVSGPSPGLQTSPVTPPAPTLPSPPFSL